jgi:hypothetical protein
MKIYILKKALFVVLLISYSIFIEASNEFRIQGARSYGCATASVTKIDIWSSANNQASIGFLDESEVAVASLYPVDIPEIKLNSISILNANEYLNIGINYYRFGFDLYNENKFSLFMAKAYKELFSLGISLDYFVNHFVGGFENTYNYNIQLSSLFKLSETMSFGVHTYNPLNFDFGHEKLRPIFRFGISELYDDVLLLVFEVEKEKDLKEIYKIALEYTLLEDLYIRSGFATQKEIYSVGIGYVFSKLKIDCAYFYQDIIKNSLSMSLSYAL